MLKKAFQKQYNGIIWKIRPDETATRLVLEIRDPEKKEVFFSCLRTADGAPGFDGLRLDEPWFCGLEAVAHGHAFFHGYLTETLPEHRGIVAHRLDTGELAWADYNLVFGQAVAEGILAWNYKSEPRRYQLIDAATGAVVRSFSAGASPLQETSSLPYTAIHLPFPAELKKEELEHLPEDTLPVADRLTLGDTQLLAFYVATGKLPVAESPASAETPPRGQIASDGGTTDIGRGENMDHYLRVVDNKRQIIHEDLLDRGILQRAMDTFFVMGNQLCYVKRKSEILTYLL